MNKLLMNKKVVNIINETSNLNYVLNEEELIVNYFCDNMQDINIDIVQTNNSKFVLNFSCLIHQNCNIKINGKILGNNNECIINLRTVAEKEMGNFDVTIKAEEKTIGNEIVEDLKGLTENGKITFLPVLEVETDEVEASHFATIGALDKNELFYLQTKGISLKSACELLKKSFIYNLFSDEFISQIGERKQDE